MTSVAMVASSSSSSSQVKWLEGGESNGFLPTHAAKLKDGNKKD